MYKLPSNYKSILDSKETEHAIVLIKNFFQLALATELNLRRVTAPLFVPSGSGVNDDLNGVEKPVSFQVKDMNSRTMEIVQSLAKWKRLKITELGLKSGFGIYTDMNAIRPSEELDAIHSLYVDQWDWELAISETDRTENYLHEIVKKVYRCIKRAEFYLYDQYSALTPILPEKIKIIHADELLKMYPTLSAKEREEKIAKDEGAVFITGIGGALSDGSIHDGRAPDYDDWITISETGRRGLNGDIIVWNPVLQTSLELSSMGVRVCPSSLMEQLAERKCEERKTLLFHKKLLDGKLTQTLGGGIGQSRLCMFLLKKAHIGEVQVSMWSDRVLEECKRANITLL